MIDFLIAAGIAALFSGIWTLIARANRGAPCDESNWRRLRMMNHLSEKMSHGPNWPLADETRIGRFSLPRRETTAKK